jgi:hypothetical protein
MKLRARGTRCTRWFRAIWSLPSRSRSHPETPFSQGSSDRKQLYARALAIDEKTLGHEHPELAEHLIGLAVVHREASEHTEARTLLEPATMGSSRM